MRTRKQYISEELTAFKERMLPALANGDEAAYDCLQKAHIDVPPSGFPIAFSLDALFTATWIWATRDGVALPQSSNFAQDFAEFSYQLMTPWPDEDLRAAGLKMTRVRTSKSGARYKYQIERLWV